MSTSSEHIRPRSFARRRLLAIGGANAVMLALPGCSVVPPSGVSVIGDFELPRYLGRWWEIARLDHRFERGLSNVSATYSLQDDGSVRVLNRGFDEERGRWREATGRALQVGLPTSGSLKVSFFGPFYGGYHIVARDPDYRWSLVIGPDLGYCWILSRVRQLTMNDRKTILTQAQAMGIDTDALIWVAQNRIDPAG